jgi:hypothetical protein
MAQLIWIFARKYGHDRVNPIKFEEELNTKFKRASFGFRIDSTNIIRVDSEQLHAEAVLPALSLLRQKRFEAAEHEYRNAHEHYRNGHYESAIVEAGKAFESVLKTIIDGRKWGRKEGDAASKLLATVFDKGLIPPFLQTQFNNLRGLLESGAPTVRNKAGGHGAGGEKRDVPEWLAAYVLHVVASNMLMLASADDAMQ